MQEKSSENEKKLTAERAVPERRLHREIATAYDTHAGMANRGKVAVHP